MEKIFHLKIAEKYDFETMQKVSNHRLIKLSRWKENNIWSITEKLKIDLHKMSW